MRQAEAVALAEAVAQDGAPSTSLAAIAGGATASTCATVKSPSGQHCNTTCGEGEANLCLPCLQAIFGAVRSDTLFNVLGWRAWFSGVQIPVILALPYLVILCRIWSECIDAGASLL